MALIPVLLDLFNYLQLKQYWLLKDQRVFFWSNASFTLHRNNVKDLTQLMRALQSICKERTRRPCTRHEDLSRSGFIIPLIFKLGTEWRWISRLGRFNPSELTSGNHWIGGWEEHIFWTLGERKTLFSLPRIEQWLSFVQPVALWLRNVSNFSSKSWRKTHFWIRVRY